MKSIASLFGAVVSCTVFALNPQAAALSLGDALDAPALNWSTGGSNLWFGQALVTHFDGDAAESGAVGDLEESWLQTTLVGPGEVGFWWKVSSEPTFDFLEFWLDGQLATRISGEMDWAPESFSIAAGTHLLRWRYTKDVSQSHNLDRAWVDQLTFVRTEALPAIRLRPLPEGRLELSWPDSFADVVLNTATDLVNWARMDVPVVQLNNTNYVELDASGPTSFYQAVLQPLVTGVSVESGRDYPVITGLQTGIPAYSDREFLYANVPPEVQGATYLVTANDDKFDTSATFLSFQVSQPVTVYVVYDDRYLNRPAWLADFQDSGLDLMIGPTTHSLYRKSFPPGVVTLGGNYVTGEGNNGMYTVLIAKSEVTLVGLTQTPLYLGSYVKVPVQMAPSSGLTLDDLEFVVPAGARGGTVSLSRDDEFDPAHPDIMLLAGYEPGTYQLQAVEKATGLIRGQAQYSITTRWPNERDGPSRWVAGDFVLPGVRGATWGGGSPTAPGKLQRHSGDGNPARCRFAAGHQFPAI